MKYSIATPGDHNRLSKLASAEGFDTEGMQFPTVMATDDDNKVVGFLATNTDHGMVLAGPLVLRSDKVRPMVAVRLIEVYERAMLGLGITSFIFHAEADDSFLVRGIERFFPERRPYAIEGGKAFYVWPVTGAKDGRAKG